MIATYNNRRAILERTLEHLHRQTVPTDQWEIVIVDDGSTAETGKMVEEVSQRLGLPCRYFHHEHRGPGYTQNFGIEQARRDIILLLADDIWPQPDLVAEHLRAHAEFNDETIGFLGNVRQSPELPPTALHQVWDPFQYWRFHGKVELDNSCFLACHISVKRSFLMKHELYLERPAAAHEDIELGYRLSQHGLRLRFNERALGDHYHPETLESICRRAYERGYHFDLLTASLPPHVVYPLYKVLSLKAGWPTYLRMLPRELARSLFFNRFTVKKIWQPAIEGADRNPIGRWLTSDFSCRGVAGYHMRAGYRARQAKKRERLDSPAGDATPTSVDSSCSPT